VGHAAKLSKCHAKNSGREGKHTFVTCSPIPLEESVQVFRVEGGGGGGVGGEGCKG